MININRSRPVPVRHLRSYTSVLPSLASGNGFVSAVSGKREAVGVQSPFRLLRERRAAAPTCALVNFLSGENARSVQPLEGCAAGDRIAERPTCCVHKPGEMGHLFGGSAPAKLLGAVEGGHRNAARS